MPEDRFSSLPTEILQRIALETVPLSWNHPEIWRGRPGPPTTLWALHLTSRRLRYCLLFAENPVFYATVFERAFDFDSVRRRYSAWSPSAETLSSTQTGSGSAMFGPAAFAWEGRKRWYVLHRVRKAAKEWEHEYRRCKYCVPRLLIDRTDVLAPPPKWCGCHPQQGRSLGILNGSNRTLRTICYPISGHSISCCWRTTERMPLS